MSDKEIMVSEQPEQRESFPAIIDTNIIAIADEAEKRLEALNKIKRVALKLTNRNDWVDESGRPYLQASGAEKVGRLFGVSWQISEPIKEELEGGHFSYTYKGKFYLGGASIEAIGTRSSKDGFFKKYKYAGDERLELPASEIDRGDVKKSAYTNLLGNGITRLLGIRNLTYDDLKEYAGITQDQVTRVEFKKGGKQASQTSRAPSPQPKQEPRPTINDPGAPATEAQVKAIHAILTAMKISDELGKMEKVKEILGLKEVPTSASKLSKSQASTVIAALQKEAGGEQ